MKFLYFLHSPGIGTNCAVLAAKTLHGPCNGNEGFHLDEPSSWVSCDPCISIHGRILLLRFSSITSEVVQVAGIGISSSNL